MHRPTGIQGRRRFDPKSDDISFGRQIITTAILPYRWDSCQFPTKIGVLSTG